MSGGRARLRRVEQPRRRLEAQAVAPLQRVLHGSREGCRAERLPEPHHAAVVDAAHPNPTIELVLEVIAGFAGVVTRPVIVFVAAAAAAPTTVPVAAVRVVVPVASSVETAVVAVVEVPAVAVVATRVPIIATAAATFTAPQDPAGLGRRDELLIDVDLV